MLKLLVDESSGKKFSKLLKLHGFDVTYSGDIRLGADDEYVLGISKEQNRILVTSDKDFGELIFRYGKSAIGVVLLRLRDETAENKIRCTLGLLKDKGIRLRNKFVILSEGRVRIRKLPFTG